MQQSRISSAKLRPSIFDGHHQQSTSSLDVNIEMARFRAKKKRGAALSMSFISLMRVESARAQSGEEKEEGSVH